MQPSKSFPPLASPLATPFPYTFRAGSAPPTPSANANSPFAMALSQSSGLSPGSYHTGLTPDVNQASPMQFSPSVSVPDLVRMLFKDAVDGGWSAGEFMDQAAILQNNYPANRDAIGAEVSVIMYTHILVPEPLGFNLPSTMAGFTPPAGVDYSFLPSSGGSNRMSPATPRIPALSPAYASSSAGSPTDLLDLRRPGITWASSPKSPWTPARSPSSRPPSAPLSYSNVPLVEPKLMSFPPKPTPLPFTTLSSSGPLSLMQSRPVLSSVYNAPN